MFSRVTDSESLKADISASKLPVIEEDFGYFRGGKVYFIKTSPHADDLPEQDDTITVNLDEMGELQNLLDQIPDGRKAEEIFNYFSGGNFINTRTGTDAMKHHQLFARVLHRPTVYLANILQALDEFISERAQTTITLKELSAIPVRHALFSGMFDNHKMTPAIAESLKKFSDILEGDLSEFKETVELRLLAASRLGKIAFNIIPRFINARSTYAAAMEDLISAEAPNILEDINKFANNESIHNLFALAIIELIKESSHEYRADSAMLAAHLQTLTLEELESYLMHPDIVTIPASIAAGDNVVTMISCILAAFANNSELLEKFRQELADKDMLDFNDHDKIKNIIRAERYNHGFIHRVYLEALRREDMFKSARHLSFETITFRYNHDQPIEVKGIIIPPHSTIAMLPAMPRFDERLWNDPEHFNPDRYKDKQHLEKYALSGFSTSRRRCPAHDSSEYMVLGFLAYLVTKFDISLENTESKKLSQINVQLTPRPLAAANKLAM